MLLLFIFLSFFNFNQAFASIVEYLKSGDVLIQSNRCYYCSLIEEEEGYPFSHIGILVKLNEGFFVLETKSKVTITSLKDFLLQRKKDTKTLVLRHREFFKKKFLENDFLNLFYTKFYQKNYDKDFLWNNFDDLGEKYYCSEFAAKFLNYFLVEKIKTKAMHFNVNREVWIQYFKRLPPDGKEGISPVDFFLNKNFKILGEI